MILRRNRLESRRVIKSPTRNNITPRRVSRCLFNTTYICMHTYTYTYTYTYLSGTFITCQLCGFWHFSVVSATFASACKHVVTWGGVCVIFLKSARKRQCMGLGGRGCHFSAQHNTWDGAHKHSTAPFIHFYSESLSLSALLFSGRAGTPLGQTSPFLWTGTYFFNFCQSCKLFGLLCSQPMYPNIVCGGTSSTNGGQVDSFSVWTGGIAKSVVRLGQ